MENWEPEDDWYYESNIQDRVKEYYISKGWELKSEAKTQKRNPGPDLLMQKNNMIMRIEVKGYPSDKYVSGDKKGFKKTKTTPSTQARHWFSEVLTTLILAKCKKPNLKIVMVLPDFKSYTNKIDEIKWLRKKINFDILVVSKNEISLYP